jgi:hypothetical protein
MKHATLLKRSLFGGAALWAGVSLFHEPVKADPSKYPQFAQQKLPDNITPAFISVDQLVNEITAGKKPFIIDVRSGRISRGAHSRRRLITFG